MWELKRPRLRIVVAFTLALLSVVLLFLYLEESDSYILLYPSRPELADPLVQVPGEPSDEDSRVMILAVYIRNATLLERLAPFVRPDNATLESADDFPLPSDNYTGIAEMARSQRLAVAFALRQLGYKIEIDRRGLEVDDIAEQSFAFLLNPGDVIVAVNGHPVTSPRDLARIMTRVKPGALISVSRRGKRKPVRVRTQADPADPSRAVIGIVVEQAFELGPLPIEIEINTAKLGGPSAGLALALTIVDELDPNFAIDEDVAVTGALGPRGQVEAIGGVKQKVTSAEQAGAMLVIVPRGNLAEARRYAKSIRVVAISSFAQALSVLASR